jgi:4-amino-4-deoxy-L-arabinose transferase-like glycosyltransferase
MKNLWIAAAIAAGVLCLYLPNLGRVPPYLHHDEVFFANQAHAIASTGRDTDGRLLPLSFEVYPGSWFQPILVYFTALFLKVLPLSESAGRVRSAGGGAIVAALVYLIAVHAFGSVRWALVASALMAITPAHLIHARIAMDYLYPIPFVLLWLLCVTVYLERHSPSMLFLAGLSLGVGFFSYVAAWALMPVYLCITGVVILTQRLRRLKSLATVIGGFAGPLVLAVPFMFQHPETLTAKWRLYGPGNGAALNIVQQLSDYLSYGNLSDRVSLYFEFFNPSYLFMSGGVKIVSSTRTAGVFLLPLAVLIPIGIYQRVRYRKDAWSAVVIAGFATAPIAAVLISEHGAVERELELIPFGVLLAVSGLQWLWGAPMRTRLLPAAAPVAIGGVLLSVSYAAWTLAHGRGLSRMTLPLLLVSVSVFVIPWLTDRANSWRAIAACLLLLCGAQFVVFYRDYLTDYRRRSAGWFEFNHAGAMEDILAREPAGTATQVLVSKNMQYADAFWRFYCSKAGRDDLRLALKVFDPATTGADAIRSPSFVLVLRAEAEGELGPFPARTQLKLLTQVPEVGGGSMFSVLTTGAIAGTK